MGRGESASVEQTTVVGHASQPARQDRSIASNARTFSLTG